MGRRVEKRLEELLNPKSKELTVSDDQNLLDPKV